MKNEQKWVAAVAALCLGAGTLLADAPAYTIIKLPMLPEHQSYPGYLYYGAADVNMHGQVVGSYGGEIGLDHTVVWDNGVMHDIGPGIGGKINSSGTVLGNTGVETFVWDAALGRRRVPIPFDYVYGIDLNDAGQIAGRATNADPWAQWAFLFDEGAPTMLAPEGAWYSSACAIDSAGHVAGNWERGDGTRGFIYRDGEFLDWRIQYSEWTQIYAMNDLDVIVFGYSDRFWRYIVTHDFRNGRQIYLHGRQASASAINNLGQVIGSITDVGLVLWDVNGDYVILDDLIAPALGWQLSRVTNINDAGVICGQGEVDGMYRAFLLIPGTCPGDIAADGEIGLLDLSVLLSAFGSCSGDVNFESAADLNSDGCIGLDDLGAMLAKFGTSCP